MKESEPVLCARGRIPISVRILEGPLSAVAHGTHGTRRAGADKRCMLVHIGGAHCSLRAGTFIAATGVN